MNRNSPATITYCVDLAKNKFQVHAFSAQGECVKRSTLGRSKFDTFFANPKLAGALVVMEACASSNYWARLFVTRGLQVKLVPAQFVAKQRIGNKNDGNDADGIYAVHRDVRVRPVPVKTLEQQDLCAEHRLRELLVCQRTQCINQARGLLAERGCVAAKGDKGFAELLKRIEARSHSEITDGLCVIIRQLATQIETINQQIGQIEKRLTALVRTSVPLQQLQSIHGIGVVTATAFAAEYGGRVDRFADARQFAASIGTCPREDSSGETRRLGSITKRGNSYLRKLLIQCGQSVTLSSHRRDDQISMLARRLLEHKTRNHVVVAVANHLARIIYAVIKNGQPYRPHPAA
jgi:transposase